VEGLGNAVAVFGRPGPCPPAREPLTRSNRAFGGRGGGRWDSRFFREGGLFPFAAGREIGFGILPPLGGVFRDGVGAKNLPPPTGVFWAMPGAGKKFPENRIWVREERRR
jgi:hypothetical protein